MAVFGSQVRISSTMDLCDDEEPSLGHVVYGRNLRRNSKSL